MYYDVAEENDPVSYWLKFLIVILIVGVCVRGC